MQEKEIKKIIVNNCPNYQTKGKEYYFAELEDGTEQIIINDYNNYCIAYDGTCPLITVINNKDADIREFIHNNRDICSRFINCILPTYPALAKYLDVEISERGSTRKCAVCGTVFIGQGRAKYCCPECANKAKRKQKAEYQKKYRVESGKIA